MKSLQNTPIRNWARILCLGNCFFAPLAFSQTDVDAPVTARIEENTDIDVVAPTNTFYGTRGLSQTSSAEALGEGRLVFGLYGSWYQQQKAFLGVPNKDANIFTGIGSVSLGVNRQIDIFASLAGFGSTDYSSDTAAGLGSLGGGVQGTLPVSPEIPIRMAAQVGIYQGLSGNQVNLNGADGYNYFETRTGLDFMARLIQTLTFGHEDLGFKAHFNEGLVTSAEDNTGALLLLGAGTQFNLASMVFGLEMHSRTPFKAISIDTDPLWISPSVQFRTPFELHLTVGGDIALSQSRNDVTGSRALEPFRLFAGMAFTFDTEYGKRAAMKAKEQQQAREKEELKSKNAGLANALVTQSREDSLAQLRQKEQSDSLTQAMAEKSRQDSLEMAAKAHKDSLALVEAQKNLMDEKSKRSDAEKQLLSTGLLLMDAVYFETGKVDISINSKPYLNIIAKMLAKYPKLRIEVAGHTDNVGSAAYNLGLSDGRAQSVASYMISVSPPLAGTLTGKGYGLTMPKADNNTADGRKHNRRTELQVLNKEALSEYNR